MSGKTATGKTIGEVEKLTGIPKRKLKYFIEQGLVQPSQKSESLSPCARNWTFLSGSSGLFSLIHPGVGKRNWNGKLFG